jgi:hypothetical protein
MVSSRQACHFHMSTLLLIHGYTALPVTAIL